MSDVACVGAGSQPIGAESQQTSAESQQTGAESQQTGAESHVCSFCIRGWLFCCRHTTMNELSSGQKMASPVRSPSWRRAFGPSGGRGSPHPMYSGRLYPRGGLPLRRPGPGSVPPPRTGRLQKPLERRLRSQPKVCPKCASPARPSPCHACCMKQTPREPCLCT